MEIKLKADNRTNFKRARKTVNTAMFKTLEHVAAGIRRSAINSIHTGRKRKNSERVRSKPGEAPKTWAPNKWLKQERNTLYGKTEYGYSVFLNPKYAGNRALQMLELGGTQRVYKVYDKERELKRRNHCHGFDPNAKCNAKKVDYYRSLGYREFSKKEAQHIQDYYKNYGWKYRAVKYRMVTARYKPRPFLGPAAYRNLHRIPTAWKASVQTTFQ